MERSPPPSDVAEAAVDRPSSRERQEESSSLAVLAKTLVRMKPSQLAEVVLPDEVRKAVLVGQTLSRRALARHLRRIAQLMRGHDVTEIKHTAADAGHKQRRRAAREHIYEHWRQRLMSEGDAALAELVDAHPMADPQRLRALLRVARRDPGSGKSMQAMRNLLRLVREIFEAEAGVNSGADAPKQD